MARGVRRRPAGTPSARRPVLLAWSTDPAAGLTNRCSSRASRPRTANLYAEGLHETARAREWQRGDELTERVLVLAGLGGLLDDAGEHGTGIEERRAGRGRHRPHGVAAGRSGEAEKLRKSGTHPRWHRPSVVVQPANVAEAPGYSARSSAHSKMRRMFEADVGSAAPLEQISFRGPRSVRNLRRRVGARMPADAMRRVQ